MSHPWHNRLRAQIERMIDADRVPSALMLHQPPGWGIADFAAEVVARLIPGFPDDIAAVRQVAHPDFLLVERDGRTQIVVDQIRTATGFVFGTAQHGRKVVLLLGAEHMNASAANALLKSLEEPPGGNVLLLVTERPDRLLPTIRSRCQVLTDRLADPREAFTWLVEAGIGETEARAALALCGGAPLLALAAATDVDGHTPAWFLEHQRMLLDAPERQLAVARELASTDPERVLDWWAHMVHVTLRTAAGAEPCLEGVDRRLAQAQTKALVTFAERVNEARAGLRVNLNPALLIDNLVWQLAQIAGTID